MMKDDKEKDSHLKKRRKQVIAYFKQDGVNNAPYAYKLWPEKEKSNARSQFTKCLNGKLNDEGFPYSFTDSEINELYSLISSTSLNESNKSQKISLTESEFKSFVKNIVKETLNKIKNDNI